MHCTGYEMARYKGTQASHLYEKSMHTLCTIQWATAPGRSLNYPRPKSFTHLHTFSDNGVYVALQLFLVILVSDQWRQVLIPYSYRQTPWGLLHARRWLSRYTWDQQLYVVSEPRKTHSPMLKARFLHLTKLVAQPGIEPPTSWLPGQRVTTRKVRALSAGGRRFRARQRPRTFLTICRWRRGPRPRQATLTVLSLGPARRGRGASRRKRPGWKTWGRLWR